MKFKKKMSASLMNAALDTLCKAWFALRREIDNADTRRGTLVHRVAAWIWTALKDNVVALSEVSLSDQPIDLAKPNITPVRRFIYDLVHPDLKKEVGSSRDYILACNNLIFSISDEYSNIARTWEYPTPLKIREEFMPCLFETNLENELWHGYPDFVRKCKVPRENKLYPGLLIRDYKTGRAPRWDTPRHRQLSIYAMLASEHYGITYDAIDIELLFLGGNKYVYLRKPVPKRTLQDLEENRIKALDIVERLMDYESFDEMIQKENIPENKCRYCREEACSNQKVFADVESFTRGRIGEPVEGE